MASKLRKGNTLKKFDPTVHALIYIYAIYTCILYMEYAIFSMASHSQEMVSTLKTEKTSQIRDLSTQWSLPSSILNTATVQHHVKHIRKIVRAQ